MVDAEKRRIGVLHDGGSIEKDQKLNMDAQDAQDNQGTLLHEKLTDDPADLRMLGKSAV